MATAFWLKPSRRINLSVACTTAFESISKAAAATPQYSSHKRDNKSARCTLKVSSTPAPSTISHSSVTRHSRSYTGLPRHDLYIRNDGNVMITSTQLNASSVLCMSSSHTRFCAWIEAARSAPSATTAMSIILESTLNIVDTSGGRHGSYAARLDLAGRISEKRRCLVTYPYEA